MLILILFAFLSGIVTILSPCILPVLPLILSGSVGQGRLRPFGIIFGFIFSFTFFTLALTALVKVSGVSADYIRYLAIFIVICFGLVLLIPQLQAKMEALFSRIPGLLPKQKERSGFIGGVLLGISLGLLWTPCVGPILASVIAVALTGAVSQAAVFITLAYATGTALPMLAITYGGRGLLQKIPWLTANAEKIQKGFGVVMILVAIGIFFNLDRQIQSAILRLFPRYGAGLTQLEDIPVVRQELSKLQPKPLEEEKRGKPMYEVLESDEGAAPELILGGQWFNSPPLTLEELRGKVVVIDFWTYTCINCIRTLPYIERWHETYKDKGLVIIGVHTPEFEFEKNPENVKKAIKDFGLTYPVMQDNDYETWNAYLNRYWPAKYFIDKNGRVRWTHFGEGAYDESEAMIQKLLAETGADVADMPIKNPEYRIMARTPELYLGYGRIQYLASPARIFPDKPGDYKIPSVLPLHTFGFGGEWAIGQERAAPSKNAALELNFEARDVFLVMRPEGKVPGRVRVLLDGKPVLPESAGEDVHDGLVMVESDRLYRLVKLSQPGKHLLKLEFLDGELELYAFTFG